MMSRQTPASAKCLIWAAKPWHHLTSLCMQWQNTHRCFSLKIERTIWTFLFLRTLPIGKSQLSTLSYIVFQQQNIFSWQCQFSVASLILSFKRKRMFVCMCVWYIFNKLEKLHKCEPIGRKSLSGMVLGKVSESVLLTNVDKSPV